MAKFGIFYFLVVSLVCGSSPSQYGSLAFTTTAPVAHTTGIISTAKPFRSHNKIWVLNSANPTTQDETVALPQSSTTKNNVIATATKRATTVTPLGALSSLVFGNTSVDKNDRAAVEYQKGLITIGFITLLFSSNSPVLHSAFHGATAPPVLLLNAAVSVVALVGLVLGGETLEQNTELPSVLQKQKQKQQQQQQQNQTLMSTTVSTPTTTTTTTSVELLGGGVQEPQEIFLKQEESFFRLPTMSQEDRLALQGGCELGLWKFLGTTANIYGLSLTTAAHGAFLIQLTTLIVPVVQGLMGVPIPKRIQFSIVLALAGVVCFTQDPTGTPSAVGDLLCVVAATFYATYDLRLFSWGKQVAPRRLITGKIATQALLSLGLLAVAGSTSAIFGPEATSDLSAWHETVQYLSNNPQWSLLIPVVLWSGVAVNAIAPFLQVGGQQAVGPTRCQTIYASQPLWASIMSFVVFGETIGWQGLFGGTAFLTALFLAATTEAPDPDCGEAQCEV